RLRAKLLDAPKTFVEGGAAPEEPQCGGVDRSGFLVDLEIHHVAQAAEAGALKRFGKDGLRIEPGDERLRADQVRDGTGGDAYGAVGTEMDAQSRKRRQHRGDGGGNDPFPNGHAVLPRRSALAATSATSAPRQPRAAAAPSRPGAVCHRRARRSP